MRTLLVVLLLLVVVDGAFAASSFLTPDNRPYDALSRSEYDRELTRINGALAEVDALASQYAVRIREARQRLIDADKVRNRAAEQAAADARARRLATERFSDRQSTMINERRSAADAVRRQQLDADASVRWARRIRNGISVLLIAALTGIGALCWRVGWRGIRGRHVAVVVSIALAELAVVVGGGAIDDPQPPERLPARTVELSRLANKPTVDPTPPVVAARRALRRAEKRATSSAAASDRATDTYNTERRRLTSVTRGRERLVANAGDNRRRRAALEEVDAELTARGD